MSAKAKAKPKKAQPRKKAKARTAKAKSVPKNGKGKGWTPTGVQRKIVQLLAKRGPMSRKELIAAFGGKRSPSSQCQLGFSEHSTNRSAEVYKNSLLARRVVKFAPPNEETGASRFELTAIGKKLVQTL